MKNKGLQLKCDCGCKSQVMIQLLPYKDSDHKVKFVAQIDTRDSGRHRWHGVVLSDDDFKKVREFLKGKK